MMARGENRVKPEQAVAQTADHSSLSEPAQDIFFEVRSNPILLIGGN
jgi:hypothetical protein